MACDDDPAAAGRLIGRDEVLGADAGFFILGAQGRGILVGADAADVEGGVGGKDVLRGWMWVNVAVRDCIRRRGWTGRGKG